MTCTPRRAVITNSIAKECTSPGAAQGYLIDKKTAEQYHIPASIDQLKDPQIVKLFDTNNDGKADLTGCTPQDGAAKQ